MTARSFSVLIVGSLSASSCHVPSSGRDHPGITPETAALIRQSHVPRSVVKKLREKGEEPKLPSYDYPWTGLEKAVKKNGGGMLPLIGYGSLLNPESAKMTISNTPRQGQPPVLAVGAVRSFSYRMPSGKFELYKGAYDPKEMAALNLAYTGSPSDLFNGRLIQVKVADIPALRKREFGYHLRPVKYVHWGEWTKVSQAYVLVAEGGTSEGHPLVDHGLLPFPPYASLCRAGASSVSADFLSFYLGSTYVGDGNVLSKWELTDPRLIYSLSVRR